MESTHSCCLAVRCISALLLQTTLYPVPGNPTISAYLHRPRHRDLPFLGSRCGLNFNIMSGDWDILLLMTKTTKITLKETLSYSTVLCSVSVMKRHLHLMRRKLFPVTKKATALKWLFRLHMKRWNLPSSLSPRAGKKLTFVRGIVEEEFVAMCCTG